MCRVGGHITYNHPKYYYLVNEVRAICSAKYPNKYCKAQILLTGVISYWLRPEGTNVADERDWVCVGRGKQYLCRTIVKVRGTVVHATAKTIQIHPRDTKRPKIFIRIFCTLDWFVHFCG